MPRLSEKTKLLRLKQRIKALKTSKSITEFGYKVAKEGVGSRGGKNKDKIACVIGHKELNKVDFNLLEKLTGKKEHLENIVRILTECVDLEKDPIEKKKFEQMKWGIEQSIKLGVGGGYSPSK